MNRDVGSTEPPYLRIVSELRHRIAAGELGEGDRVPSTRQIAKEWGVAIATATKVLTTLRQEGLVRVVPGVGTVVAGPDPRPVPARRTPRRRTAPDAAGAGTADQTLNRERVVRAAIEVADAEGLAALSMRRVAAELGVATMALYRHVDGKDELVFLMADTVCADDPLPSSPPPGWEARLELMARLQWALYRRHPWLAQFMSFTRPPLLPHAVSHTEWALSAVDGLGLDPATMLHIAVTMSNYVRGTAVNFASEAEAEAETGVTGEQWMESQEAAFAALVESGRLPVFARVTAGPELDFSLDSLFGFGLRCVLDGIAVLIGERTAGRSR
ncbi:TetR/AcrR family transcriptional regulator C-terminal domain-containing protein [Actinomadura scrupuli]|uniref:TetR/AcrR family transcriptional regulator C-terminal domain-containing protein n=1 Tax=Actinomadura scrupuli TaxID=559629 RepID=UPI003D97F7F9